MQATMSEAATPIPDSPEFNDLWDTKDPEFLEKVACKLHFKLTAVDAKTSRYELRLRCKWKFRTVHTDEKTETRLRVPGLRLPGLKVVVEESRVWKDIEGSKGGKHTLLWRGVSRFIVTGHERFEMQAFPYDRQLVSLDIFEFVWRQEKDSHDYDLSMDIASLDVTCESLLPEWQTYNAIVRAEHAQVKERLIRDGHAPETASRFSVRLRLERKNWFYMIDCFGMTILITILALLSLCVPCDIAYIGDRMGLLAGGVLTLTSFKYSVTEILPLVSYSTKFDKVTWIQFVCLLVASFETLISYRILHHFPEYNNFVNRSEEVAFLALAVFWAALWLYLAADHLGLPIGEKPCDWLHILNNQEFQGDYDELPQMLQDNGPNDELSKVMRELEKVSTDMAVVNKQIAMASRAGNSVKTLTASLAELRRQRSEWEEKLQELLPKSPRTSLREQGK